MPLTTYCVQYVLPVDNPVMNVRASVNNYGWTFFMPLNHPDAHNIGFQDLMAAWELGGKQVELTYHKKKRVESSDKKSSKEV